MRKIAEKLPREMLAAVVSMTVCIVLLMLFAPRASAATVLDIGSTGLNVTKVQQRLIQYDYLSGTADGIYGEKTKAAVKLFQQRNNLTVDGRVGPATAAALGVTLTSSSVSTSATQTLLAKLVYGEARGEPYKGMVAVAAVVLNRVRSSSFPNTVSGVIFQSGAFSCVNNGQLNYTPNSDCLRAAKEAMNGWDPTGGALYFYNPNQTSDSWIRTRTVVAVIGNHYFAK